MSPMRRRIIPTPRVLWRRWRVRYTEGIGPGGTRWFRLDYRPGAGLLGSTRGLGIQ